MTKEETIKIMAMLGAFYGAGKSNPEIMATAWHLVLEPYDYPIASRAVLEYARNDRREYATFPSVGNIVAAIEDAMAKAQAPITEIIRAISYGWDYNQLTEQARATITIDAYNSWLNVDAEEFANQSEKLAESLKRGRKQIEGVTI